MMITRRTFIKTTGLLVSASVLGCNSSDSNDSNIPNTFTTKGQWRMPDESEQHARTWMAFATSADIWGVSLLAKVQANLILIAHTISKYEPVSMLVQPADKAKAEALLSNFSQQKYNITLIEAAHDDLWMRDTSCVFVVNKTNPSEKAGINFNFNGWGKKQKHDLDATVAPFMTTYTGVTPIQTNLVLEGGAIEVDGVGTAIIAESCVLNDNRNPNITKESCEAQLKALLGLDKIIWIPGIKNQDITDGHTDFYARFAGEGLVLAGYDSDTESYDHNVTLTNIAALENATDAKENKLKVIQMTTPTKTRITSADFAAGYIGFYACNGAIIAQQFGDAIADAAALNVLQNAFPNRVIEQLNVDAIAQGGGSIHCTTQQEPI